MLKYSFNPDLFARYDVEIIKENCELLICGYGKLVILINKETMNSALIVKYASSEESYKRNNGERTGMTTAFMSIYMPEGSDEFKVLH